MRPLLRWHVWRSRRATRRRVRALAATHSMIWLTEDGPSVDAPVVLPAGVCHICAVGRHTRRDPYSGVRCCDHCGAPADQVPGSTPRDGVAAGPEHLEGECGCRSVGRPDIDARERERAYL